MTPDVRNKSKIDVRGPIAQCPGPIQPKDEGHAASLCSYDQLKEQLRLLIRKMHGGCVMELSSHLESWYRAVGHYELRI